MKGPTIEGGIGDIPNKGGVIRDKREEEEKRGKERKEEGKDREEGRVRR